MHNDLKRQYEDFLGKWKEVYLDDLKPGKRSIESSKITFGNHLANHCLMIFELHFVNNSRRLSYSNYYALIHGYSEAFRIASTFAKA
jgi:hypothetical protein